MVNRLSNKLMIQLQNYINSSANLQRRGLSKMRKNLLFFPTRKFIKSGSHSKPRYQTEEKCNNQEQTMNQARSKYEQLMKIIREPLKRQLQYPRYSLQKERIQVANFIKFKSRWKPRLGSELNIERCHLEKNLSDEEIEEKNQISKTIMPQKKIDHDQNHSSRKYSMKTEQQQHKGTFQFMKPKTTILKRILDAKQNKHIRSIIKPRVQGNSRGLQSKDQDQYSLKRSHQILQHFKKQSEPLENQLKRKKNKLGGIMKAANFKSMTGQQIAGWTVKQYIE